MLLYALQTAVQGRGSVVLVEGDAGVGKTRLIQKVVANAEWRSIQIGRGKADSLSASAPYQVLVDALSPLLTPLRLHQLAELVEPQWLSAASRLLPAIVERLPDLPSLPSLDPHAEQQRLWQGLAHCLTALTASVPLLLVLEDLHWADDATLAALPHLVEHLPASRALLILICRTAETRDRPAVHAALDTLDRTLSLLRLRLRPLEHSETATLVQHALATGKADAQTAVFAQRLQAQTGGNALFLVETLKSLLEQGALVPLPGGDPGGGLVGQALWTRLPGRDRKSAVPQKLDQEPV